jgi:hypothetical protein
VAESVLFDPAQYNLAVDAPLKIGFGANDFLHGQLRDLRVFQESLSDESIRELSTGKK